MSMVCNIFLVYHIFNIIVILFLFLQVLINIGTVIIQPIFVDHHMPRRNEKIVEMVCNFPVNGYIISLSYNVLLVMICAVYAFKTRQLPDNFNESKCIALCVYTTLVIWLAFFPTYFTTAISYVRTLLLACALLLNSTLTILCLYAPKLYALHSNQMGLQTVSSSAIIQQQNLKLYTNNSRGNSEDPEPVHFEGLICQDSASV